MKMNRVLIIMAVAGLCLCLILLGWMWSLDGTPTPELSGPEVSNESELSAAGRNPQRNSATKDPTAVVETEVAPTPTAETQPPGPQPTTRRPAQLRVVAAESGLDLKSLRVVEIERADLSRVEHPGNFQDGHELSRGDSPLPLPIEFEIWDRLALLAPGREALFFSLDARSSVDRHFELKLGARLDIELLGFRDDDFQGPKTRLVIRRDNSERQVIIDRPADLGRRFSLDHLPTGPATLSIERYPIDSAPPLAQTRIRLEPATVEPVQLQRLPDPAKIIITGQVVLPNFLQAQEWCSMTFQQAGFSFQVEAYASREPATASALDFSAELPATGAWTAEIEGQTFDFEVDAKGRHDLRFVVIEQAAVHLHFSGIKARDLLVTWKTTSASGSGYLNETANAQVLNPPAGPVEVQLESDDGYQVAELIVPSEGLKTTIAWQPPISFWVGVKFEDIHVQFDIEDVLTIKRLDPGPYAHRILLRDPFRCRVALSQAGRYELKLQHPPAGYLLPEPLIIELEPGTKSKFAFHLERQP